MTFTQEDLIKARDKAAKALERLDRIIEDMRPEFDWNEHFDTDAMTFAEQLHMPAFVDDFKEKKFKVTVWIARPYTIEVDAVDEDAATQKVEDEKYDLAESLMRDETEEYGENLAVNMLTVSPYDMVAVEV